MDQDQRGKCTFYGSWGVGMYYVPRKAASLCPAAKDVEDDGDGNEGLLRGVFEAL